MAAGRRQLERGAEVERFVRRHPGWADQRIAAELGASRGTVYRARARLLAAGRIAAVDRVEGRDGRTYPARRGGGLAPLDPRRAADAFDIVDH